MKLKLISLLVAVVGGLVSGSSAQSADLDTELSQSEADAIVRAEMQAKENQVDQRVELLERLTPLKRIETDLSGQKVVFKRMAPSTGNVLRRSAKPQAQAEEAAVGADIQARLNSRVGKESVFTFLLVTVYDREITEIQWSHKGKQYTAFSNIDFNLVPSHTVVETDDQCFSYFYGVRNTTRAEVEEANRRARDGGQITTQSKWVPKGSELRLREPGYVLVSDDGDLTADDESAYLPIDALHEYFRQYEDEIRTEHQRSAALGEARKKYLEKNPPNPEDSVIYYWPHKNNRITK